LAGYDDLRASGSTPWPAADQHEFKDMVEPAMQELGGGEGPGPQPQFFEIETLVSTR